MRREVTSAAAGTPPPSALDVTRMSGTTSACSKANHRPVRPRPVSASSAISKAPRSSQNCRTCRAQFPGTGMMPPDPSTNSTITAAGSPELARSIISTDCRQQLRLQLPHSNGQR
jgi:hypothetical protein